MIPLGHQVIILEYIEKDIKVWFFFTKSEDILEVIHHSIRDDLAFQHASIQID